MRIDSGASPLISSHQVIVRSPANVSPRTRQTRDHSHVTILTQTGGTTPLRSAAAAASSSSSPRAWCHFRKRKPTLRGQRQVDLRIQTSYRGSVLPPPPDHHNVCLLCQSLFMLFPAKWYFYASTELNLLPGLKVLMSLSRGSDV